jgi:hypothetical protein
MVLHLSYHLDPVQGPAGIRFRDILPLLIPEARFLIFGRFPHKITLSRQLLAVSSQPSSLSFQLFLAKPGITLAP